MNTSFDNDVRKHGVRFVNKTEADRFPIVHGNMQGKQKECNDEDRDGGEDEDEDEDDDGNYGDEEEKDRCR